MAQQYAAAREDLRRTFEALPQEEQDLGRTLVRRLRAREDELMQRQERVRKIEKMAAESGNKGAA